MSTTFLTIQETAQRLKVSTRKIRRHTSARPVLCRGQSDNKGNISAFALREDLPLFITPFRCYRRCAGKRRRISSTNVDASSCANCASSSKSLARLGL